MSLLKANDFWPERINHHLDYDYPKFIDKAEASSINTSPDRLDELSNSVPHEVLKNQRTEGRTIDKVPTENTYKKAWEWRDSIPEVKHTLKMVGYDSFEDSEDYKGKSIKTIGLFDKSQLHPIYKPFK